MSFKGYATLVFAILPLVFTDSSIDRYINTESWPFLYKSGSKQVANLLWYEEGLYAELPYGYVDKQSNVTSSSSSDLQPSSSSKVRDVQKVTFPPRLHYFPVDNEERQLLGEAVLSQVSQVNEQMFENRRVKVKSRPKKRKDSGALDALKSLAFSILDQWLFSAGKRDTQKDDEVSKRSNNETSLEDQVVHPMRYLFLLGLLPTTFGSLYSLGYTSLQIMVIGAYIVTSYFIFVEKYPDKTQEEIYEAIEEVINKIIKDQKSSDNNRHPKLEENSILYHDKSAVNFKLDRLVDWKSSTFITQFDSHISNIFEK